MKTMTLLFATTVLTALGCEAKQDVGNDGGGGAATTAGQSGGAPGAGGTPGAGGQGGEPDPSCAGKACGTNCLTCPPNEPQCLDPSYQGFCNANGTCAAYQPDCSASCGDGMVHPDTEECDDGNQVGGDGCSANCLKEPPCLGKTCGMACFTCSPNEPGCSDPSYPGFCDIQGACLPPQPSCQ